MTRVLKTGDYATCAIQMPKGLSDLPLLLTMTSTYVETGRQGWYGDEVKCVVLWDNGETVQFVGHRTVKLPDNWSQEDMATEIIKWLDSLGGVGEMVRDEIVNSLNEMIPL